MSFKLKLVFYFLLVSLLPLGAAGWALHSIERSSETRRVDVRLEAGLRAVTATYKGQLAAADLRAKALARNPDLQEALLRRDRRALRGLVAANRGVRLETSTLKLGPARMIGPGTRVAIVNNGAVAGTLVSGVPLTRSALARLRSRSGLDSSDRLVVLQRGRIVGGPRALTGAALATTGSAETLPVNGTGFRTLATTSREGPGTRRSGS